MPKERDPFHKYVDDLENRKWRCKFCGNKFAGSTPRIRAHFAGIPGRGIKACEKVDNLVRAEALQENKGEGSGLDKRTRGTSVEGTEGTDMQNSNQLGCAPQQPSFYPLTGTGTAPARPQDQGSLPPGDMPVDNLDNTQQSNPSNRRLDSAHRTENASSPQQLLMDSSPSPSLDFSELPALLGGDVFPTPLLSDITTSSIPPNSNEQYPGFAKRFADEVILDSQVDSTENLHCSPPENPPELPDAIANASEESTGGMLGEGMERTVFGVSQSVLPSDSPSNPNHTQNSNQLWCAPQQPSFYQPTGTCIVSACPQDQRSLPPGDRPLDNLDNTQQRNLLNPRLDAAHGNEIASSFQQPVIHSSASASLDFSEQLLERQTHLELETEQQNARGLSSFQNYELCGNSRSSGLQEFAGGDVLPTPLLINMTTTGIPQYSNGQYVSSDKQFAQGITPDSLVSSDWSNLFCSLPEYLLESCDVDGNTFAGVQTNELHDPTVQIDSSLDVDSANRLQHCGQPCVAEGVPVCGNTSPTDTVQRPGQLPTRCDKEDGNDIRQLSSRTPMEIDPSTASQHTSVVDSLVPEAATNTIGTSSSNAPVPPQHQSVPHQSVNLEIAHKHPTVPLSSRGNDLITCYPLTLMDINSCMPSSAQAPNNAPPAPQILACETGLIGTASLPEVDLNEGAPMMSHPNTGNNFEENRDLKRKLELLYEKEADMRVELEYAASLYLKKLRMEVANWLADVEKLRNDCTEAANKDCLPPHQRVDTLMHEAKDLMRLDKGLFEARETKISKLLEDKMVGEAFQRNTTEILEFLVGNQISRLGICGMGGVGKTTIMMHIHNRLLDIANYGNVLWITVSQDFDTERLQDAIWKELGSGILQEKDVRKRAAVLYDCLMKSGKSTIILDDVWECFDLNEIGIPIGADGIKLVLTTRSFKVCHEMHCQKIIKIEPLSQIEAESLFLEELGSEVALDLESEAIVKSIVKECAGLPLAVITMARSMQGVTAVFEWEDSLEKLRESDMGQMEMETKVLMKLKFSYDRLGNHEVQQCFLSCALYPEDYSIDKFELIEFFIDQGLIGPLSTRKKQYDRGLTILNKLINACLLADYWGRMKMHDLIRDMALHIMSATSIVRAGKGLCTIPSEEYWTDALEKVSLMMNKIKEFPSNMSPSCPKLSIFLMNWNFFYDVVIPDSFFKQLQGLKVLNLSGCKLRELPDSISDVVNLRALLLRECKELCRIPYLGKLRSLRKLDIFNCERVEVIEGLEMLVNLRYLDILNTCIKRLPKGTLGALVSLQYLEVEAINEEDITKLRALEELSCSIEDVDDFNKYVRLVSEWRNKHRYYNFHVCRERPNVRVAATDNARFENRQRTIRINSWSHAIVSTGGESNGSGICILIPQDVQKLTAFNCDGATNLSDIGPLEDLEELEIRIWKNLRVLCGGQGEDVIDIHDSPAPLLFPSLRVLAIYHCPKLKYLFGHGLIFSLPHLQSITIHKCEKMVGITVAVTSPPPHRPLAFPSLEKITVSGCDKIKGVLESEGLPHFPNLREINVSDCENMEEIIRGPPPYMLVEEISLERLHVRRCHNLRKLFPHELLIHLRNLEDIRVSGCKGMVEMKGGAGQGQEGSTMTLVKNTPSSFQSSISLPKLETLGLHELPLKSICEVRITCYSLEFLMVLCGGQDEEIIDIHDSPTPTPAPPLFSSLMNLYILNCPKLEYLFGHGPKFSLPHLQMIETYNCEEMVGIASPPPQPAPALPSLEVINVRKCGKMKRVVEPEWLPHFPKLKVIEVSKCENMEEIIGGPPPYMPVGEISLKRLWVKDCHNIRRLFPHEWLLHLRNLDRIDVDCCKGMVEMISGAGQGQEGSITTPVNSTPSSSRSSFSLPKLKTFQLCNLPQLKSICEVPITCDSMEFLTVTKCPELNSIPLQLRFHDTQDLPYIWVQGEEKWKTLIWDHPHAQDILQSHFLFKGSHCILQGQRSSSSYENEIESGSESESESESGCSDGGWWISPEVFQDVDFEEV